jgi:hypothetical protein
MRRVLRYDGLLPNKLNSKGHHVAVTPDDLRAMKEYIEKNRTRTGPLDFVVEGTTSGTKFARTKTLRPWVEAGATWWLETVWENSEPAHVRARIRQGPPGLE